MLGGQTCAAGRALLSTAFGSSGCTRQSSAGTGGIGAPPEAPQGPSRRREPEQRHQGSGPTSVKSRNKFLGAEARWRDMRTLTREETVELARRATSPWREASIYALARTYGVTDRWVRELRRRFLAGEPLPGLARVGRPPRTIPPEGRALILRAEDEERLHAVALERAIERYRGIHIPHNRIWRVLKEAGRVRDEPRKQQRR